MGHPEVKDLEIDTLSHNRLKTTKKIMKFNVNSFKKAVLGSYESPRDKVLGFSGP